MTLWLWIGGAIVVLLLLLIARGMYLIGQGTDAELQAREQSSGAVSSTGWMMLDNLRDGDVPIVSTIERWIGIENESEEDDKS